MAGSTARRRPPLGARLAVVAGVGAAVVLATPGPATADTDDALTPTVTCVRSVENGSWTAVFGYTNSSSRTITLRRGGDNDFDPDRYNGPQIETFAPGTHQGAFSVLVPSRDSDIEWELGDRRVTAHRDRSTRCPSSTELPADGNGMGVVIALAAAGAVGGTSVYVSRRRRERGAQVTGAPSAG
jgi:hypothetical protein